MSLYGKFDMRERVDEAHRHAIERLFAAGDPQEAAFRRICYAAMADDFTSFMASRRPAIPVADARALRDQLVEAIANAEGRYASGKNQGDPSAAIRNTSLAEEAIPFAYTQEPPTLQRDAPRAATASGLRRPGVVGGLIGASLVLLAGLLLKQADIIQFWTDPSGVEIYAKEIRRAAPEVESTLALMNAVKARLESLRGSSEPAALELRKGYKPFNVPFPELYEEYKASIPRNTGIVVRLTPDGKGYKMVVSSDYCSAVAVAHPGLVDPVRNTNTIFCRYLGYWDETARRL